MKNLSVLKLLSVLIVLSMVVLSFGVLEEADSTPTGGPVIYQLQFEITQVTPGATHDKVTKASGMDGGALWAFTYNSFLDITTSEVTRIVPEYTSSLEVYGGSGQGEIAVGTGEPFEDGNDGPIMWTPEDGWDLVPIPWRNTSKTGTANTVSTDGRYVVGYAHEIDGSASGFVYDREDQTCSAPITSPSHPGNPMYLKDVSNDGTDYAGFIQGGVETPVVFVDGTPNYPYGVSPGNNIRLNVMSGDGTRVAGYKADGRFWTSDPDGSNKIENAEGFAWPEASHSEVTGISEDGNIVVGYEWYGVFAPCGGFVWTPDLGGTYQRISTYLFDRGVTEAGSWGTTYGCIGVSDDGNAFLMTKVTGNRVDSFLVYVNRPQTPKPSTRLDGMPTYVGQGITRLHAEVTDAASGYSNVKLYVRELNTDHSMKNDWSLAGTMSFDALNKSYFYDFNFQNKNYYEFYSQATDTQGWVEPAPSCADISTSCTYGGPSSYFKTVSPYNQKGATIRLERISDAWPGIAAEYQTWYRSSNNNASWSGWALSAETIPHPHFNPTIHGIPSGRYIEIESVVRSSGAGWETRTGVPDTNFYWTNTSAGPPQSYIQPIIGDWTYYSSTSVYMTANWGCTAVQLWYSYEGGSWTYFGQDITPGMRGEYYVSFNFPAGEGSYEFYSIATKGGWPDETKSAAEEAIGQDQTVPYAGVENFTTYVHTFSPLSIDVVADDGAGSGLKWVNVYYRYSEANESWGGWVKYESLPNAPWEFDFDFPCGSGYYQFTTKAVDIAGKGFYPFNDDPLNPCGAGASIAYFEPSTDYYNYLDDGWNLVSAPADYDLTIAQLQSATVGGDILAVQAYDPATQTWMHYSDAMETAGIASTLSSVSQTISCYILFDDTSTSGDGSITFVDDGLLPDVNRTTTLEPGWNLVGYPSYSSYVNITESFGTIWSNGYLGAVETLDGYRLKNNDGLEGGEGYWVYLDHTSSVDWIAPL